MTIKEMVEILEQEYEQEQQSEQKKKCKVIASDLMNVYEKDWAEMCMEVKNEFGVDPRKTFREKVWL